VLAVSPWLTIRGLASLQSKQSKTFHKHALAANFNAVFLFPKKRKQKTKKLCLCAGREARNDKKVDKKLSGQ